MTEKKDYKKPYVKPLSKTQEMIKNIGVSEKFTKPIQRKNLPKMKTEIFHKKGYNYEADLLMLPKTKEGYKYLLTMIDLYSNYLDFEPMKTKTAKECLEALLKIFKRKYLKEPKASIRTDNGGEFKEAFDKYLENHDIVHHVSLPYRHRQNGNIEALNKLVGRVLMTYLTNKEMETGKPYYEWLDILDKVRVELNKIKEHPKDEDPFTAPFDLDTDNLAKIPKYKVGDLVYRPLEQPRDIYGNHTHTTKFRTGDSRYDPEVRKVKFVVFVNSPNVWRYILKDIPNVAYDERELILAEGKTEETFTVRKIIDKRIRNKKIEYLVWWKKDLKKNSTWEPKERLLEDGVEEYIDEFEQSLKQKTKKKRKK